MGYELKEMRLESYEMRLKPLEMGYELKEKWLALKEMRLVFKEKWLTLKEMRSINGEIDTSRLKLDTFQINS